MLNVFHRDGETIRHFWGSELFYAPTEPGQDPRHVGTLEPVWNLLDLTPEGRPADWDEQLRYPWALLRRGVRPSRAGAYGSRCRARSSGSAPRRGPSSA